MVAGMERYYQIARCYRDEDFRADRQPEFTQLDMEISFVDVEDIIAISEEILTALWALIGYQIPTPIPRMTYADAMRRFGSDKPDLRFGLELVECTEFFSDTTFRVFQAPYVGAVVMPGGAVAAAAHAGRLAGVGQTARTPRTGLCAGRRRRHAGRPGGQEPDRRRTRRPGRARRRRARGLHLLLGRPGEVVAGAAGCGPQRDRQPARPDRPDRVGLRLGGRPAAVRARRRGDRRG